MVGLDNKTIPIDQAYHLRKLVAHSAPPAVAPRNSSHVIAVASGKGGVGKTLVAANLSIALAAQGHRVILFDMDMGLANADIVLGVEAGGSLTDVLSGRRELDEIVIQGPGQIAFVPGASGVAQVANLSEFERHQLMAAMQRLESRYDIVVLDCGAGISRNVVGFGAGADTILVIATPEPTAITDAYAMIKAFAQDRRGVSGPGESPVSIGVLVNLADSRREGQETYERIAGVAARFLHLPITDYGYILRDEHVPAAVRGRCPVILRYPRCSASTCMMSTASRLSREMGQPQPGRSLFYRVMNMFV